jgi:hypothetical protein
MPHRLSTYKKSNHNTLFWFESSDELLELGFTKDEIALAIEHAKQTVASLTSFENVEAGKDSWLADSDYAELVATGETGYFKEYEIIKGKEFVREYTAKANQYRTRGNYQSTKHASILKHLLINKFQYLKKYKFDVYSMRSEGANWEFYLKVNKESLYVPVRALLNKDSKIIVDRMSEYHGWFRSQRDAEQKEHNHEEHEHQRKNGGCGLCQEKFYQKSMKPLKSVIVQRFFEDLEK